MSRSRKILAAAAILLIGILLALPFRKSESEADDENPLVTQPISSEPRQVATQEPAGSREDENGEITEQGHAPKALLANTSNQSKLSSIPSATSEFDLMNHPSLGGTSASDDDGNSDSPETNSSALSASPQEQTYFQPAYSVGNSQAKTLEPTWPTEIFHVVRNGDTLEKLAKRYLKDESRALEIFDLNRDHISNPHLLPIGAELRIPVNGERLID